MVSHIFSKVISSPIVTGFRGLDVNCFEIVSAPINTYRTQALFETKCNRFEGLKKVLYVRHPHRFAAGNEA